MTTATGAAQERPWTSTLPAGRGRFCSMLIRPRASASSGADGPRRVLPASLLSMSRPVHGPAPPSSESSSATSKSAAPRILLVIGGMYCGGAQRVMAGMANYWAAKGWHIELATWSGPEIPDFYELAPNIPRIWLDVPLAGHSPFAALRTSAARITKLRRLLRKSRPDCVISFIDVSNIYAILASIGLGLRVIVSERTNPAVNYTLSLPWRVLRRICYSWATQVVAQTRDAGAWIERTCRARVAVIPNSLRTLPHLV